MWGVRAAHMRRHEVTEDADRRRRAARRRARLVQARPARRHHRRPAERTSGHDLAVPGPAALTCTVARMSSRLLALAAALRPARDRCLRVKAHTAPTVKLKLSRFAKGASGLTARWRRSAPAPTAGRASSPTTKLALPEGHDVQHQGDRALRRHGGPAQREPGGAENVCPPGAEIGTATTEAFVGDNPNPIEFTGSVWNYATSTARRARPRRRARLLHHRHDQGERRRRTRPRAPPSQLNARATKVTLKVDNAGTKTQAVPADAVVVSEGQVDRGRARTPSRAASRRRRRRPSRVGGRRRRRSARPAQQRRSRSRPRPPAGRSRRSPPASRGCRCCRPARCRRTRAARRRSRSPREGAERDRRQPGGVVDEVVRDARRDRARAARSRSRARRPTPAARSAAGGGRTSRAPRRAPTSARARTPAHAPIVAATIETGVPSAVPNSSPLAPASSGPGNSTTVSRLETTMNTSGPATP